MHLKVETLRRFECSGEEVLAEYSPLHIAVRELPEKSFLFLSTLESGSFPISLEKQGVHHDSIRSWQRLGQLLRKLSVPFQAPNFPGALQVIQSEVISHRTTPRMILSDKRLNFIQRTRIRQRTALPLNLLRPQPAPPVEQARSRDAGTLLSERMCADLHPRIHVIH